MAKKSAKSKGYRKTIKKKPFLTKKEIIELVVIVAVIILGIVLFNVFYDDGFVKEVQPGEIVTFASGDLRDRYKKLGDIGEIEGFTLQERDAANPLDIYSFLPDDAENSDITSISVNGSFLNASDLCATTLAYMEGIVESKSDILETTIQGYDANVFSYSYSEYDPEYNVEETAEEEVEEAAEETADAAAEEAEQEPNKFCQSVSAYIAMDDTHTLCLHIYRRGADESCYLAQDELIDYVSNFESAFTVVEKK